MTDFITEEMREAVARALFRHEWQEGSDPIQFDDPDSEYQRTHEYWLAASRAALTAALPLVIEECAKVADPDAPKVEWSDSPYLRGVYDAATDIAQAIRSLLPTTTKEG
jgi:hypothetical protein